MFKTPKYVLQYGADAVKNYRHLSDLVKDISQTPAVNDDLSHRYLSPHSRVYGSLMGVAGMMLYDMAVGPDRNNEHRSYVGQTASELMSFINISNTILGDARRTLEDKIQFLDITKSHLLSCTSQPSGDMPMEAYCMARRLYENFISKGEKGKAKTLIDPLYELVKAQFVKEEPEELLRQEKQIGALILEWVAIITEVATSSDFPEVRKAARYIGKYGQLKDGLYDIDKDLKGDDANTYAAMRIIHEGDSRNLRLEIKRRYLEEMKKSLEKGFSLISDDQREIYRLMKQMIDWKFRLSWFLGGF